MMAVPLITKMPSECLNELTNAYYSEVACRPNTNDYDELTDLIDSHESLLAYALDNRLE